jgi:hypothetical protein
MFKSIADQSITAVMAAALLAAVLVAGLAVFLTAVAPAAKAGSPVKRAVHEPHAKGDRLPALAKGTACSSRGWPHYEQSCQFDMRRPATDARSVRVIALR